MKRLRIVLILMAVLCATGITATAAAEKYLTIVHTNDMHSHFQGFAPEVDYRPFEPKGDATLGGWARVATVIDQTRKNRPHPVLVLDAGDFSMGSFFHMLAREEAFEPFPKVRGTKRGGGRGQGSPDPHRLCLPL